MSESAQITQISDNVNQGYIAGRDLYLGDQYVVQETLYFEPDLANVEPPAWTSTPKAAELARALAANRLIVLAGQDMDDKTMVARHLAWLLRRELPGTARVREWYRSSDPQKIETAFHESDTTILLLPQVQPHHVGHRLNELSRVLDLRRNYAVITTDGTRADWGVPTGSDDERLWQEISWESYYGRPFLADTLLAELALLNGNRPDWLPRTLQPGSPFAEGLSVEEVAARLKQPERIRRFTQWIQSEAASPQSLLAQLDQLGGDRAATQEWYQQLAPSDQIFALGLVLFDGLPDDQIFAAVEYLVDSAWRRTDPNLPLFDYRDLARLGANFHLVESGEDGTRIETASRRKREAILQTAWELQRRRLLAVVPAMTRLVKRLSPTAASLPEPDEVKVQGLGLAYWRRRLARMGAASGQALSILKVALRLRFLTLLSAKSLAALGKGAKTPSPEPAQDSADEWRFTQGPERELFSSLRRVEQLQRSVIETLSQIGLLSFEAVEASFLELGAEGSIRVQTVVAKALAAWRGKGHHERLFQVLRSWWQAGSRSTPPKALAQRVVKGAQPLAGIRSTVALAVGYALQYDPPNQMAPELQSLLQDVVADRHPALRQRVLELTLPLAAASHPQQLESFLRDRLVRDQEQMNAIAFGLAMAFTLHPFGALRTLDSWHVMVRCQGEREPGDRTITPRDRLLSAVAMAYGYIRCDPSQALLSTHQVVAALRSILDTETHPFVRTHALMAAGLQGLHDFELVAPLLIERLSEIALPDRKNVVSVFVRAYLKQREQLRGGDGEIEHDGRTYQIWLLSPRPLTPIETALYSWLRSGDHPVARQVAAQTFAAFTATELEQQERALGADQKQIPSRAPSASRRAANPRRLRRLPILGHLAACVAMPFHRRARTLVRPVLAEMVDVERSRSRGTFQLLDRWRSSGDEEVQDLARSAATAFRLYRWRWTIIFSLVLSTVLALAWWEWRWSHQAPLPEEEVVMLQQRRTLPLRFALARGASILRPEPKPDTTEPAAKKADRPRRVPSDLPERLLWSSISSLERRLKEPEPQPPFDREPSLAEVDELKRRVLARIFAQLLLDYLRKPENFQTAQQLQERALQAIDREFPRARARARVAAPPPSQDMLYPLDAEAPPEELLAPAALTPPPFPGAPMKPMPLQLDPNAQGTQIDVDAPSLFQKIRKTFSKKKPPQGGDHDPR